MKCNVVSGLLSRRLSANKTDFFVNICCRHEQLLTRAQRSFYSLKRSMPALALGFVIWLLSTVFSPFYKVWNSALHLVSWTYSGGNELWRQSCGRPTAESFTEMKWFYSTYENVKENKAHQACAEKPQGFVLIIMPVKTSDLPKRWINSDSHILLLFLSSASHSFILYLLVANSPWISSPAPSKASFGVGGLETHLFLSVCAL